MASFDHFNLINTGHERNFWLGLCFALVEVSAEVYETDG